MENDGGSLDAIDPLALTNTVTLSALVALLVRKGVIDEGELRQEIGKLRAKVESLRGKR